MEKEEPATPDFALSHRRYEETKRMNILQLAKMRTKCLEGADWDELIDQRLNVRTDNENTRLT